MFDTLPAPLAAVITELGFTTATPIQAQALPPLLEGRDVVGRAPTGSGKTLAFGVPLLARIDLTLRRPQALVVCPTRELAGQVAGALRTFGRRLPGLRILVAAGGVPGGPQRRALEEGVHVVVGTPGRLVDHLERGNLDPNDIVTLVLDEADRMLDMGFADDMERVLEALPPHQTALFSATFPPRIAELAGRWLDHPVVVDVLAPSGVATWTDAEKEPEPTSTLRQLACVVEESPRAEEPRVDPAKIAVLVPLLRRHPRALVFCNFKASAAALATELRAEGLAAAAFHGDLEQLDRENVLARLRNGSVRVLVATDVAARGLDVEGLDLVVNVELPSKPEIYVHRVGRTARAGAAGLAVALVTTREEKKLDWFEPLVGKIPRISRAELLAAPELPPEAPMDTIRLGAGRKDKLRPGDVLGALTGEAGFAASDIGKIEVQDRWTYVAVARTVSRAALKWLEEGRVKGRRIRVEPI
jgi:ATP-independent RNA helicase DbpA